MNTARSTPLISALSDTPEKGENQLRSTWLEAAGAEPPYTLISATTAKIISVMNSAPSRNCWVRADNSIPRQQIHVITAIQTTPTSVTSNDVGLPLPKSWNE